jgi:heptosyltransferase-2
MERPEAATLVVRTPNWLGDTVMALPALRAVRAGLPDARILLMGRWATLLAGQGVADVVLEYPGRLSARLRLLARVRASRPEIALVLPNSLESALSARWCGAPCRAGFAADGRDALLTHPIALPDPRAHQVDEYAMLVAALGLPVDDRLPRWQRSSPSALEAETRALLESAGSERRGGGGAPARLVGLHVGTAVGTAKRWPAASFAGLAGRLRAAGLAPLLLGGPGDRAAADAVRAEARHSIPSLVGRDRPALLPDLLSRLACLVSGDTGVAHLAAALDVPTVTLFGPTDPARTAPRGRAAHLIVGSAPCAPCFLATCPIDHVCLRDLAVASVASQVLEAVG